MKRWCWVLVLGVLGCKSEVKPTPPPEACSAAMTVAPAEFGVRVKSVDGAVKTRGCQVIAVGRADNGDVVVAKYDRDGKPTNTHRPFAGRWLEYQISVQRLAIVGEGYLAIGTLTRGDGASDVFMFKLGEDGLLAEDFGRGGVLHGEVRGGQSVRAIDAPTLAGDAFTLPVTYAVGGGATFVRTLRILVNGREPLPTARYSVPAGGCESLNHQAYADGFTYDFRQLGCGDIALNVQGPGVRDALNVRPDGTLYTSARWGEFSVRYEGLTPVFVSRDTLGNVKSEFVRPVIGRDYLCGARVQPGQRYLVFSRQPGDTLDCQAL